MDFSDYFKNSSAFYCISAVVFSNLIAFFNGRLMPIVLLVCVYLQATAVRLPHRLSVSHVTLP